MKKYILTGIVVFFAVLWALRINEGMVVSDARAAKWDSDFEVMSKDMGTLTSQFIYEYQNVRSQETIEALADQRTAMESMLSGVKTISGRGESRFKFYIAEIDDIAAKDQQLHDLIVRKFRRKI